MYGRTSLFVPQSHLEDRFGAEADHDVIPRYNIAPQDDLEVVPNTDHDTITQMNWGLRPNWVDDPNDWGHPIDARAEPIDSKPLL